MFREVVARARAALTKSLMPDFETAKTLIYNSLWTILRGKQDKVIYPYTENPTVYRAINEYSRRLSQCPIRLYEGTEKKRHEVEDPRWAKVFDDPNPEMTRAGLIAATLTYKLTDGECLWLLDGRENVADMPDSIYPVSPEGWLKIRDDKSGMIVAYEFKVPGKQPLRLPFWQVVSFRYFDPRNRWQGLSPLQALSRSLQTDLDAENVNQAFLENGAEPGGVLQADGDMDDTQVKQMVDRWEARHGGTTRRGRIAALWGGMKYQPIPFSHQTMEYLNQRKYAREEVAMAFSVPWEILGFGKATFDNYEQAERSFWQNVLKPEANEVAEIVSERIVGPATARRLWVDLDTSEIPAMQDDVTKRIGSAKSLWDMGVPLAEINRLLRLGIEDGKVQAAKVSFLPMGIQTAEEAMSVVDVPVGAPMEVGQPGQAGPPVEMPAEALASQAVESAMDALFKRKSRPVLLTKSDRWAYAEKVEKSTANVQRRMRQKVRRVFMAQRADMLAALTAKKSLAKAEAPGLTLDEMEDVIVSASRSWDRELVKGLLPEITAAMRTAGGDLSREMDWTPFDTRNPEAATYMEGKALELVEINRTTVEKIRDSLSDGIGAGESVSQLQDRVRALYNDMTPSRSLTIARTESGEAANVARQVVMKENGVEKIEWVTAHDDRVRESHEAIDGDVVKVGEKFDNGLQFPQDPDGDAEEVINCRCVAAPVVTEGEEV